MDEIFDNLLMTLALGGLAVSGLLFASALLYPYLRSAWDKATALARAAFCGAVAVACLFGGAKHRTGGISYPKTDNEIAYLTDAGSYVTNDAVHVAFTRVIVPDTATFYLDYCALDGTNEQGVATNWVNAKTATFGELEVPFDFAFANATNYNWLAYTDWTPGPAVQTNGVWHAYWGVDKKEGRYFIPVRTCVRDGSSVIATPKSKWDYEETEDYFFRHYSPDTVWEVNVEAGTAYSFSYKRLSGHSSVTVDWGDGTTDTIANSTSASHTYTAGGTFRVRVSDDLWSLRACYSDHVVAFRRWGDSMVYSDETFRNCCNLAGWIPRWGKSITDCYKTYPYCQKLVGPIPPWTPAITNVFSTYYNSRNLQGTIPEWGENTIVCWAVYSFDTKLTGTIPKWPKACTTSNWCYESTRFTGAWTDDPAELMPTNITSHANCVVDASDALRALFYSDWGGTRTKTE